MATFHAKFEVAGQVVKRRELKAAKSGEVFRRSISVAVLGSTVELNAEPDVFAAVKDGGAYLFRGTIVHEGKYGAALNIREFENQK